MTDKVTLGEHNQVNFAKNCIEQLILSSNTNTHTNICHLKVCVPGMRSCLEMMVAVISIMFA